MYISFNGLDFDERIEKIDKAEDQFIIFHYLCPDCDEPLFTDKYEVISGAHFKSTIDEDGNFLAPFDCDSPGFTEFYLNIETLTGIQIL